MPSLTTLSTVLTLTLFKSIAYAAPVSTTSYLSFPTLVPSSSGNLLLSNGFPNPSPEALQAIEQAAGGTLSNILAAKNVTNQDSLTNFKLIAFNEFFEVAFFTDLLLNITQKVPGYEIPQGTNETFLIETLKAVQAQEQLHALNANGKLPVPIQPCAYTFPTTDLNSAISLASTFTDVVLGTLQDVATVFATNGDDAVVRGVASTLGQEGQQSGFYRSFLGKRPSSQPFLTASTRDFAFSALVQNFVVDGSCPNIDTIPLKVFKQLQLLTQNPEAKDQKLQFRFNNEGVDVKVDDLEFVLISGQNKPIVEKMENVKLDGHHVTFEAQFPFEEELLFGLTIGAIVKAGSAVGTANDVAKAAIFGPALIEVA